MSVVPVQQSDGSGVRTGIGFDVGSADILCVETAAADLGRAPLTENTALLIIQREVMLFGKISVNPCVSMHVGEFRRDLLLGTIHQ